MSPDSYEAALYAAGGAIRAVEAVMDGEVDSAFALVRPPGHHATSRQAMGFCLFNNIAIATKYALAKYKLERILIIDFDVHHGNGTQEAFYDNPQVMYISTHEYPFYPGTGSIEETGAEPPREPTLIYRCPPAVAIVNIYRSLSRLSSRQPGGLTPSLSWSRLAMTLTGLMS